MTFVKLIVGDCVERIMELPSGSIHLVVTSPPYGNLRTYNGHSTWNFKRTAEQLWRVLAPGGCVCWNVGDEVVDGSESLAPMRQAIYFKDVIGFNVHDTMIYHKHSFSHPDRVRYHSVFEYVFVLSKGKPRCFNPIKDKPNTTAGRPALGINTFSRPDGSRHVRATQGGVSAEYGMRGNVWSGKTRGQEEMCKSLPHPALMPRWLARDLIHSWSNPGDTVLDPFSGDATTGVEAVKLGRNYIGIDASEDYVLHSRRHFDGLLMVGMEVVG